MKEWQHKSLAGIKLQLWCCKAQGIFSSQGVKVLTFCSMNLVAVSVVCVCVWYVYVYLANKKYDQCSCDLAVTHLVASKPSLRLVTVTCHLQSNFVTSDKVAIRQSQPAVYLCLNGVRQAITCTLLYD